jgi:segregation and condensation protein A
MNEPLAHAAPEPVFHTPPQQQEMPLAVFKGQPVLQMPQDLYIPPDALEVILEAFEGPLDLLLYLIRRQNLDILDIPVAEITRQYVDYIEVLQDLRFELAAEYLVMAAILAEIKSRMLLPRAALEEGLEADPRAELVRRLQEYERFKKAAEDIDGLERLERDTSLVSAFVPERATVRVPPPVDLREMLLALRDVLKRADLFTHHAIAREALSVRQRMGEVLGRLADGSFHAFESLFNVEEGRIGVVVTFLSVLELAKEQLLEIVQEDASMPRDARLPRMHDAAQWPAPIYVKSLAASDAGAANDPDAFELPEPTSDEHGSPDAATAARADEADGSDTEQ